MSDALRKALHRAFSLGQTYWQQADSESYKQNAKSAETLQKFNELVEATAAAVAAEAPSEAAMVEVALNAMRYVWLRDNREAQASDGTVRDPFDEDGSLLFGDELDRAIDWIVMIGSSKPAAPKEPRKFREHIAASTCWCEPELGHVNPDTGAAVWIHKVLQ